MRETSFRDRVMRGAVEGYARSAREREVSKAVSARDLAQTVVQALFEKSSLEQAETAEACLYEIVRRAEQALAGTLARAAEKDREIERLRAALERLAEPLSMARTEDAALVQIEVAEIARTALNGDPDA